ncbi:uncharacterized protein V6R79_007045 [Siganus canaliculatus]
MKLGHGVGSEVIRRSVVTGHIDGGSALGGRRRPRLVPALPSLCRVSAAESPERRENPASRREAASSQQDARERGSSLPSVGGITIGVSGGASTGQPVAAGDRQISDVAVMPLMKLTQHSLPPRGPLRASCSA